jgi:hypothetical protein
MKPDARQADAVFEVVGDVDLSELGTFVDEVVDDDPARSRPRKEG